MTSDTIYTLSAVALAAAAATGYLMHLRNEAKKWAIRTPQPLLPEELVSAPSPEPKQELPYGTPVANFHVKASILLVMVLKPLAPGSQSENGEPQVLTIPTEATVDLLDPANPVQVMADDSTASTSTDTEKRYPVLFMPPTLVSVPPHLLHETVRDLLHTTLHEFLSQLIDSPYFFVPNHQAIASDRVDSAHVILCLHPDFHKYNTEGNSVRDVSGVLHERYAGQASKLLAYAMPFTQEQADYVGTLRAHVEPERLANARMPVMPARFADSDDEGDDSEGADRYSLSDGPKGAGKGPKTPRPRAKERPSSDKTSKKTGTLQKPTSNDDVSSQNKTPNDDVKPGSAGPNDEFCSDPDCVACKIGRIFSSMSGGVPDDADAEKKGSYMKLRVLRLGKEGNVVSATEQQLDGEAREAELAEDDPRKKLH